MSLSKDTLVTEIQIQQSKKTQSEISNLEKEINSLSSINKKLKSSMADLSAQGLKNTDEYKNLKNALKDNNAEIIGRTLQRNAPC